jgi:membrane-bound lytic murein transglycosylase A
VTAPISSRKGKEFVAMRSLRVYLVGVMLWGLLGCAGGKEALKLEEGVSGGRAESAMAVVHWWGMPEFSDDLSETGLQEAVARSLAYYRRVGERTAFRFGKDVASTEDMCQALEAFLGILKTTRPGRERKKALRKSFRVYCAGGEEKSVLYTGYYEPVLRGSRTRSETYPVPLYGVPRDLVVVDLGIFRADLKGIRIVGRYAQGRFIPYYTRHEIDRQGVLRGQGLEIAWVADPIEAFFLHVQGSGRILLQEGGSLSLGYAAGNGRPYTSIGKLLVDAGKLPKERASLQGLTQYLREHPEEREAIVDRNESYVFFREVPQGPLGSIDVLLTPGRSLATDPRVYPPGALVYVETEVPLIAEDGTVARWQPVRRFMLNQDTGGAIRGPHRADIYWGSGEEAGSQAGSMRREGKLYFIGPLKKTRGTP